jgi:hypothetical protein
MLALHSLLSRSLGATSLAIEQGQPPTDSAGCSLAALTSLELFEWNGASISIWQTHAVRAWRHHRYESRLATIFDVISLPHIRKFGSN